MCLLAAIHVFIYAAAFPFFNNVDEQAHFDLAVKYSHGQIPQALEAPSAETTPYVAIFSTLEYLWPSSNFPTEQFPPPWTQPMEKIAPMLISREAAWNRTINHDSSQPPLFYMLAGLWWHLGKICGLHDGFLLYWLRFLNIVFVTALVWLGWTASRIIFPENLFLRIGVPALIAFMPQTAFYSIQNDTLSPLCFGAAFVLIVKFLRAEIPTSVMGAVAGLALTAAFLTKATNVPLIIISLVFIVLKIRRLWQEQKLLAAAPAVLLLAICAGLPAAVWIAWCKINFGDFTGSGEKIKFLGWSYKSFLEWSYNPIFTPSGLWAFVSGNLASFWNGEFCWHGRSLVPPVLGDLDAIVSICLFGFALAHLARQSSTARGSQRQALWFAATGFIATLAFLGFISIIYDFHDCVYPSREHPYFTSGRLMLGALIPFLLLFVYGLDRVLKKFGDRTKFLVLAGIILFLLLSETAIDWPVFSSQYNWYHM